MLKQLLSLLLLSAVLTLSPFQPVSSQAEPTAITSTQYTPETLVRTVYSTIYSTAANIGTISFLQRPYDYNNQTGSFTLEQSDELESPPQIGESPIRICLYYDYFVFSAAVGEEIQGHFETSDPIDFYVTGPSQLQSLEQSLCGNNLGPSVATVHASSYDLNWIAPQSGQYVFLFATHRPYGGYTTIHFTAYIYRPSVETSTLTNTESSIALIQYSATRTLTQTTTSTSPTTPENVNTAALAIIILIVGFTLIVIFMKRKKTSSQLKIPTSL